jgi:hypothetical protein
MARIRDLSRLPPEYDDLLALSDEFHREQHPITTAILGDPERGSCL